MKMTVLGVEVSEGISKRTAKAYSMGTLHVMTRLAPPMGAETNVAAGYAGSTLECDPILARKLERLTFPVDVDVTEEAVIRFGERKSIVTDLKPIQGERKAA